MIQFCCFFIPTIEGGATNFFLSSACMHGRTSITAVYMSDFCYDFLLLIDVNERINNRCAEGVLLRLYIRDWFTRSHPSKGGNRTRNRSCKRAYSVTWTQMS